MVLPADTAVNWPLSGINLETKLRKQRTSGSVERRRGHGRRIVAERRRDKAEFEVERRVAGERRSGDDRRSGGDRRSNSFWSRVSFT